MARQEHLKILKSGVKAWNVWREEHPEIEPDLSKADLSGTDLNGADLSAADLSDANLSGTNRDLVTPGTVFGTAAILDQQLSGQLPSGRTGAAIA